MGCQEENSLKKIEKKSKKDVIRRIFSFVMIKKNNINYADLLEFN